RDGEEIQAMTRDEHGIFWIGTNRGLRSFDPATGRYAKVVTNLFERVTAVVAADGQLWIGAQNALFSYHIAQRKFFLWQEADGYLPNELSNAYLAPSSDPYLYIGGSHGLVQIKKSMAATPAIPPRITLADAVVDGVSGGDLPASTPTGTPALTLPWNYKSLQLKIISLEPDLFKKRLFRYTIEQHGTRAADTKVMETYQPILHLDLLPPGNYDVHVSCYTDHGNWSAPIPLIKLEVTPPWYRDLRFLLPAALLLLALLGARLRVYIRRKEAKMKSELDQLVQQTDHEKVQFLVNISHELRTPLTLIYTPLQKVIEKIDTETIRPEEWMPLRHQLANIHQSANRMKDIINMTLDLNRISDDENTLRLRPHALNEWVCSVAETFTYELQAKQITLVYALDDTLETVDFDDRKCESVLSNLLMNALKFTPEGSRITLSTTLQTDRVRVSVADQGIGLQHADAGKLFTRFYQGDHSAGGSGIGLSYAHALIEKHGGAVGAFNHTDRGATFYFELPLSSHPAGEPLASLSPPLPDVTSSFATTAYTVVVAEDNDELRAFLADALKTEFKAVYPAANGQEAWTMVTAKMPDLVLSDIMMPVMNGYELCQKVKTDAQTSHIPVVLLTARGDTSSTTSGYQQGADAYLSKPFDLAYLQVILRNQLRNRELMKNKYRALSLRLTPDPATLPLANSDEAFLLQLNKVILDHLSSKELNVKFLTEQMGMSRSPLYAKLKALTNLGVNDYLNQLRIEKACELLLHTSHTIAEISEEVGFEYQRYFSTLFKQQKGVTPTQYKLQHAAEGVGTPVWDGSGN
ncbi:MAG: response regulator, partial [Bacteroides sp.]